MTNINGNININVKKSIQNQRCMTRLFLVCVYVFVYVRNSQTPYCIRYYRI